MKPTTSVFVSPVRPQFCRSRLIYGLTGRAAGAQRPCLLTAQDGQSKSLPGSRGGNPEKVWGYRLFIIVLFSCFGCRLASAEITPAQAPQANKPLEKPNSRPTVPQHDGCKLSDSNAAPAMVAIRPGHFQMGSPVNEAGRFDDEGLHQVTIPRPFALSRCEITVGQFKQFINETGYQTSVESDGRGCYGWDPKKKWERLAVNNWKNPGFAQTDDHPIVCVSWQDAQRYVQWLSQRSGALYRLPTEAEWEYAARAGAQTARYFGDASQCEFANGLGQEATSIGAKDWKFAECKDNYVYTAPVGSFKPNDFGLYDMLGNVWEWTLDCWHDTYNQATVDGSAWLDANGGDCSRRVVRGGSWITNPQNLRSAGRIWDGTDGAYDIGFRVARAL